MSQSATTLNKGTIVHDSPILTLEAVLTTDISYYASLIENICADKLMPPPKGIYRSGQLEPAMVDGVQYYTVNGINLEPFTDINKVEKTVVNEEGNCILPSTVIRNKKKLLSNEPFLSYRGSKIVFILVQDQLDAFAQYRRSRPDCYAKISSHFVKGVNVYDEYASQIEHIYDELNKEIGLFLGNKSWNMHFATLKNSILKIERGIDYRAYQWENEHGEDFRSGKYQPS